MQSNTTVGWPVTITITGGDSGAVVGMSNYPSLGCGGPLTLTSVGNDSIDVLEQLSYGLDTCTDIGTFTLTPQPDGSMRFDWLAEDDSHSATGTLTPLSANSERPPSADPSLFTIRVLLGEAMTQTG